MGKSKKEKKPPTKQQLLANDPRWEKIFEYRIVGKDIEAEELKDKILKDYQKS